MNDAAGGAQAVLLLVYAALLHGDGVAGCGGSAYVRFIDVIEAGQPMPKRVKVLRAKQTGCAATPSRWPLPLLPIQCELRCAELHVL